MNEFTKEELEYIFFCVDIVTDKNDEHDIYGELEEKIQVMIDNYCEHTYIATGFIREIAECKKCGESE